MLLFNYPETSTSVAIKEGKATYFPDFLDEQKQADLLRHLWAFYRWEQPELKIYGKSHPIPRLSAWVANKEVGYDYSGIKHEIQPWSSALLAIKILIEEKVGTDFNSVLLNAYRNGTDKMGWHSDNEKALGPDPLIASLNLGVTRRFDLRHQKNSIDEVKINMAPGSLLFMGSGVQQNYKHQVPVQKRVEGLRINLTFRKVLELG
jgi:alkylated DNA repair dioxygenase AlkB